VPPRHGRRPLGGILLTGAIELWRRLRQASSPRPLGVVESPENPPRLGPTRLAASRPGTWPRPRRRGPRVDSHGLRKR
jgi:hypothetical protein